jgi:hypothetical protein
MTCNLSVVRRKDVFQYQTTANQFWFDTEGYTLPTGVSESTKMSGVVQKLRSDAASYMSKALSGMVSDARTGGAGAGAVYAFTSATGGFVKDIDAPGSLSFVSSKNATAWAAHPGVAAGAAILLDNYEHADTLANGVWTDTYDHQRLETRFNFAYFAIIGVAGVGTTSFTETMRRTPMTKGGSSAAKFKISYVESSVIKYLTVADDGTTLSDTGTLGSAVTVDWDTGAVAVTFTSPPDAGTTVIVYYCQDWITTPSSPTTNAIDSSVGTIALSLNVATTGTDSPGYFIYSDSQDEAAMGFEVYSGFHMINAEGAGIELRTIKNNTEDLYSETVSCYPTEGDKVSISFYGRNVQGSHTVSMTAITAAGVTIPITAAQVSFLYGGALNAGVAEFPLSASMERYAIGLNTDGLTDLYAVEIRVYSDTAGTTIGSRQVFVTGFHLSLGDVLSPYTPPPYVYYMPRPNDANPQGRVNQIYTAKGAGTYMWQDLADVVAAAGGGIISIESGGVQVSAARQYMSPTIKTDDTGSDGLAITGSIPTGTHTFSLTDVSSAVAITGSKRGLISRTAYENLKSVYDGVLRAGVNWLPATDGLQSLGDSTHMWDARLDNLQFVQASDGVSDVSWLRFMQLKDLNTATTLQTQINSKQATITGAATSIVSSNLTANRVAVSDAGGKVGVSTVSTGDLGYVAGLNQYLTTSSTPTFSTVLLNNLTGDRIVATDASKNLVTLATGTYPSLAELAYVKGLNQVLATTSSPSFANITGTTLITGTTKIVTPLIEPVGTDITIGKIGGTVTLLGTISGTLSGGAGIAMASDGATIPITWSTVTGAILKYTLQYVAASGKFEIKSGATSIASWSSAGVFALDNASYTASLLLATDANKNVVSLSTATYPSLTELAYVKGVTSSIQTQIEDAARGASGSSGASPKSMYIKASTGFIDRGMWVPDFPSLGIQNFSVLISIKVGDSASAAQPIFKMDVNAGTQRFRIYAKAGEALKIMQGTDEVTTTFTPTLNTKFTLCMSRRSTYIDVYVDGKSVGLLTQTATNLTGLTTGLKLTEIGIDQARWYYKVAVFNYGLSSEKMIRYSSSGEWDMEDLNGNQITTQSDGAVIPGMQYEIVASGGTFTNVGAANNNVGTYFIATGTTPTAWSTGRLRRLGAILNLNSEGITSGKWFDTREKLPSDTISGDVYILSRIPYDALTWGGEALNVTSATIKGQTKLESSSATEIIRLYPMTAMAYEFVGVISKSNGEGIGYVASIGIRADIVCRSTNASGDGGNTTTWDIGNIQLTGDVYVGLPFTLTIESVDTTVFIGGASNLFKEGALKCTLTGGAARDRITWALRPVLI